MNDLKILLIEDTEADYLLLARHLHHSGIAATLHWVQGAPELAEALATGGWDLVLSDYKVPGLDFLESLDRIKQQLPDVPVILVSGSIGEETAVDLLKRGLTDFVLKDRLARLNASIERSLNEVEERRKRQEAEALFKSVIDNANSVIWVKDRDGKVLVSNKYLLDMLHKTETEMLGCTIFDLVPHEIAVEIAAHEQQLVATGTADAREETFLCADGEHTLWSIKFPLKGPGGEVHSLGAICSDVTWIKQQEAQFRRLSQEYRTLLDNVPDGIVHLSPDLRILWANSAAQEMFALDGETAYHGHHCFTAFWNRGERCAHCPVVRSLDSLSNEHGCLIPEGDKREVEIRAVPVLDEDGNLTGVIEIIRDVTAHRLLEAQYRQAQKMESIGTLAGGIAHDFNNILSAILGYGELAMEDLDEDHPARKSVHTMIEAGLRAAHLTKDLLMFSRKQVSQKEPVDINVLISRIEKFIRRVIGEDIQFETHLAQEPLLISADSHQIDQVLLNFATNARDAMPAGGYLSISTERLECDQDFVDAHGLANTGPYVRIAVADTGKGMDKQTAAKIFDPFFTTKEMDKGTGLGLAVVYGIIMDHQGHVSVYSEPGNGTLLNVYLPLIKKEQREVREKDAQKAPGGGTETILIAEDEWTVRELFARVLKQSGYTVMTAINGEEAVRIFTENRETIDLLVFDLIMPKVNGKQAVETIRRLRPEIKGIFVSGYAPENIRQKDLLDTSMEVLYKPVSTKELLRTVRRLLDAS